MASKTDKGNSIGLMDHITKEILKRINAMEKDSSNPDKETLKVNGKMMKFQVLAILLLPTRGSEDNGKKINTKSLINFFDISIFHLLIFFI